ncbi:putative phage protein [Selenomonas ruminantium subsp. lactilytica TAM6421]|uniref:Putative phage protein n=1 Tax=Selenomonas ruminantium subsp. lactilytica (strain NBRC 103574 / TAM6421) TaxID=927704 RepID=I0GU13_SELRL|nr:conserved phage C-terminal domain-containing protein [Selenomonas ruminantium]BAL84250.1 putative phage protein [Selenomonas ruminantium subsp. lactilytica TAM6421]
MDVKGLFIPAVVLPQRELTPISKMIYGLISFREQGSYGACTESAANMADILGVSTITIKREVAALEKNGYITKVVSSGKGWKLKTSNKMIPVSNCYQYQNDTAPVSESYRTSINPIPHQYQNDTQRKEKETREDTREETKKRRGKKAPSWIPFSSLPDGEVKEALVEYAKVRKGGKSPIKTARQEKLLLNKLQELAPDDNTKQVKIINEAIMRGWLSFYPLKEDNEAVTQRKKGGERSESFKQLLADIEEVKNRPKPWEVQKDGDDKNEKGVPPYLIEEIVVYLNFKADKHYDHTEKETVKLITDLFNSGYTKEDIKKVIEIKAAKWIGTKCEQYLRPQTLFRADKFKEYVKEKKPAYLDYDSNEDQMMEYNRRFNLD